ncbi:MAG: hypothetical protein R3F37_14455 [Candidatus Competibacteraceae bacterium]
MARGRAGIPTYSPTIATIKNENVAAMCGAPSYNACEAVKEEAARIRKALDRNAWHPVSTAQLLESVAKIAAEAGLLIWRSMPQFSVVEKDDSNPLTAADTASHNLICERLRLPNSDIPILSGVG